MDTFGWTQRPAPMFCPTGLLRAGGDGATAVSVLDPDTVSGPSVAVVSVEPDLSIGEVAAATGLSVRVLRHWETLGLVQAKRHASGHRRYGRRELVRLARAVALRRAGLGLHDIAAVLHDRPAAEDLLHDHLREVQGEVERLTVLRDRLASALSDPDSADTKTTTQVIRSMVLTDDYVHGYQQREGLRLRDQAQTLADLLHHDTVLPTGGDVLELGCGVGAQTLEVLARNPDVRLTVVDRSASSLTAARASLRGAGRHGVDLIEADLFGLPHDDGPLRAGRFDVVLICFVLEHLDRPAKALQVARRLLRPGGSLIVIEGDHGSTTFHPDSADARAAIGCQVALQRQVGGDPDIGRRLYPLLVEAGFIDVEVTPRQVYVDGGRPALADGFVRRTFTAMVQGVRTPALAADLTDEQRFDQGIADLLRTAEPDGTFSYTFYKATAHAPLCPTRPESGRG